MEYRNYETFARELLTTVKVNHHAIIICNWQDAQYFVEKLNGETLNGKSLVLDIESADCFDDDIITAQMNDGNMLITIYDNGFIYCEPALFTDKAISFIDSTYFVENKALSALDYAITSKIIRFSICSR